MSFFDHPSRSSSRGSIAQYTCGPAPCAAAQRRARRASALSGAAKGGRPRAIKRRAVEPPCYRIDIRGRDGAGRGDLVLERGELLGEDDVRELGALRRAEHLDVLREVPLRRRACGRARGRAALRSPALVRRRSAAAGHRSIGPVATDRAPLHRRNRSRAQARAVSMRARWMDAPPFGSAVPVRPPFARGPTPSTPSTRSG